MSTDATRLVAEGTGSEHDAVLQAVQVLEAALASPATGREEAWRNRVAYELEPVIKAVAAHCRAAEGSGGLVSELEAVIGRPRVLTKVSEEHRRLATEAGEFLAALAVPEVDVTVIRARAADLTADLRAHQAHEADLIYEAFFRDIGVGD